MSIILAYVPVMHQGYLNFFKKHPEAKKLCLVNEELTKEIEPLVKDIRALPAAEMQKVIQALGIFEEVNAVGPRELASLALQPATQLVMPEEEFMHELAQKYFPEAQIIFDTTFLRWDRKSILVAKEVTSAQQIPPATFNKKFLHDAEQLKEKSTDWWRQVGGVIVKDDATLLSAWNQHVPSKLEPYFNGDPRANFHKGEFIELSTAIHAESALIAEAAKKGIALSGTDLYVTTFPCPVCAKLVAATGIKNVYFSEGYAMLDGESILQAAGVGIFKVTSE